MVQEQLRQLIFEGFEKHVNPIDREIPIAEFKGHLPFWRRVGTYINYLLAFTDEPFGPLKGPYPEILVDPVERTTTVIRRYPEGPGAIQYV
ncbi:hypothetical protein A3C59_02825 [Candidatus Daviesbacteria bacterium RIFCSPHIGHO2_02_FULL_36_13]|uniref:Uncharacterized protein n=1 Tax=Candidatus Daviesbacteria bacterium RIFCSPHIGHO2_02_FULL_36_13 TaxID=1797768 RepID=A0A1F5JWI6_9BACT|nr:MAG: hypothetical protein A3C59_02825 [Candidatus Daviesbacteria bacterium RIFCSPHIGHO2_02_FULL_36_13]